MNMCVIRFNIEMCVEKRMESMNNKKTFMHLNKQQKR